jgi:pimeloyl-ACP methyl ester carboxylesterase
VWQYKSGKISTQDIRGIPENKSRKKSVSQPKKKTQYRGDEARKPGVQAAVKRGGQYRLVVGHDYGITERENREAALGEVFGVRKWEKVAKLILTSEIASWASDYLSIALQPYFRRTIKDGFLEFDGWKRLNDLRVAYLEYLPDSHRATVTENIGQLIKTRSGSLHIRITGRAGVGKNTFGFRNDSSAFTGI